MMRHFAILILIACAWDVSIVPTSQQEQIYLPALSRPGTFPQSLRIPADYVLDGVSPLYFNGSLWVAVETVASRDHSKIAVVYHETGLGLTPVLTVTAISAAPSLLVTPDGRLLVAGSDRDDHLRLVEVPTP